MGRRNYDLTGITPGSPAWILQQERKHRRAGLPGQTPLHQLLSTPTGAQNDLPVDEDRTPRSLPTVSEEEADDRTPTVANFPENAGHLQDQHATSREIREPPTLIDPNRVSQRPSFETEFGDNDPPVQDPSQKAHGSVTNDDGLTVPISHPKAQALGFGDDVAPTDNYNMAVSNAPEVPAWQPMTMEDFHIGNMVLQGLAAHGSVRAQASSFDGGQNPTVCSGQNDGSGEDIVMGDGWCEQDIGVSTFPNAPHYTVRM
ncbi:hypothetical protein CC79DRAFT_1319718 [Sarocladium strictum]